MRHSYVLSAESCIASWIQPGDAAAGRLITRAAVRRRHSARSGIHSATLAMPLLFALFWSGSTRCSWQMAERARALPCLLPLHALGYVCARAGDTKWTLESGTRSQQFFLGFHSGISLAREYAWNFGKTAAVKKGTIFQYIEKVSVFTWCIFFFKSVY